LHACANSWVNHHIALSTSEIASMASKPIPINSMLMNRSLSALRRRPVRTAPERLSVLSPSASSSPSIASLGLIVITVLS
jgi:hypothetical protein